MTQRQKDSRDIPDAGGLTLTTENIVSVMEKEIELYGLEEAKRKFDVMTCIFARLDDWPPIVRAVDDIFRREKKRLEEQEKIRIININGKNIKVTDVH